MKRFEHKAHPRRLSFLLRHGYQYSGKRNWTRGFYTWLATVRFSRPPQQVTLQKCIDVTNECSERFKGIIQKIQVLIEEWSRSPFVNAYQALQGDRLLWFRKGKPSFLLWESETPDQRQRKLRDKNKSCGIQPAYISMIVRRY